MGLISSSKPLQVLSMADLQLFYPYQLGSGCVWHNICIYPIDPLGASTYTAQAQACTCDKPLLLSMADLHNFSKFSVLYLQEMHHYALLRHINPLEEKALLVLDQIYGISPMV